MEHIISESRRKREWYYADGVYFCKENDKICAKLRGEHLPNPDEIRFRRSQTRRGLPFNVRGLYRVEPDPITIELWNDWQRRQSMG